MISTITFVHGVKTCASEPGVFCKWLGTMGFGMRHVCMLFDQAPLLAKDGWLQRCGQCLEEFGETEGLAKPESEPVAWLVTDCIGERFLCFDKPNGLPDRVTALYTKD